MLQRYQLKSHQNIYYQNIIYIVPFIIKLYKPSSKRFGKVTGHRPLVTLGEKENINQNAKNQEYGKWNIVYTKFVNTEHYRRHTMTASHFHLCILYQDRL